MNGLGMPQDTSLAVFFMVNLPMKVTGLHTNSLDRQVTERVNIENFKGGILMNRRNEMGGVRLERMQYRRWGGNQ